MPNHIDTAWVKHFNSLNAYASRNAVLPDFTLDEHQAEGKWLNTQVAAYNLGELTDEQVELLTMSDPCITELFDDRPNRQDQWQETLNEVVQYVDAEQAIPPTSYISPAGRKLSSWLGTQRNKFLTGTLKEERLEALKSHQIISDWITAPRKR